MPDPVLTASAPSTATPTQTPSNAPDPVSTDPVLDTNGTKVEGTNWRDSLPDDLKGEASLQNFLDVAGLAKSYLHANKMVGTDKVPVPGANATDEDWSQVFNKLGRPESADKYEIKLQDGQEIQDSDFFSKFKAKSHELGLLPKQVQGLFDMYNESELAHNTSVEREDAATVETGINGLKKEWGEAYEPNCKTANLVLKEYGHEGLLDHLETRWGNDPHLIKLLANIGSNLKEDVVKGDAIPGLGGITPQQAQTEHAAMMADKTGPLLNRKHPGHAQAVKDAERLMRSAHPG